MKNKHTPGPWQLFHMPFSDLDNGIDLKGNNGNTLIANFPIPCKTDGVAYIPSDEDAANLQLISAAPELLEALTELLGEVSIHQKDGIVPDPDQIKSGFAITAWGKCVAAIAKAKGE